MLAQQWIHARASDCRLFFLLNVTHFPREGGDDFCAPLGSSLVLHMRHLEAFAVFHGGLRILKGILALSWGRNFGGFVHGSRVHRDVVHPKLGVSAHMTRHMG